MMPVKSKPDAPRGPCVVIRRLLAVDTMETCPEIVGYGESVSDACCAGDAVAQDCCMCSR